MILVRLGVDPIKKYHLDLKSVSQVNSRKYNEGGTLSEINMILEATCQWTYSKLEKHIRTEVFNLFLYI